MAERLTEKDKYGNNAIFQKKDKFTIAKDNNNDIRVYGKAIDKLAQLEDIMEKYGIESVEELKDALENKIEDISNPFLQGYVRAFFKDRLQYVEIERYIWKRACELAVLWITQEFKVLPKILKSQSLNLKMK